MKTTLNEIRAKGPCKDGLKQLIRNLPKPINHDAPIELTYILECNGLSDAIWCLRVFPRNVYEKFVDEMCVLLPGSPGYIESALVAFDFVEGYDISLFPHIEKLYIKHFGQTPNVNTVKCVIL